MDNQPIPAEFRNLVIVPGHAVYVGACASDPYDGKKWVGTYPGYKYNDEVPNYVQHIQRGVNLVDQDVRALLVFSGGKTRQQTPISEAESYLNVAEHLGWFGAPIVRDRTRLEEFATDSFENLLFSIQLFQMLHPKQQTPQRVTVVGLRFKKERYQLHAEAIISTGHKGIPPFVFRYDDVNDVPDYVLDAGSGEGEELTRRQFQVWPFGDGGPLLEKRKLRDPHGWYKKKPYK
ncbi:MAG TPA: hypothetical protein EYP19_07010 [Desulfobacterales bacterium]|nr:hypothetical protein [Desulfobacterales bacterium]